MTKADFRALNERQAEAGRSRSSPIRATRAAGSLRQLDPVDHRRAAARFFAYAWGEMSDDAGRHADRHDRVRSSAWGFPTNPLMQALPTRRRGCSPSTASIEARARAALDYDIDGVVYKVDRLDLQERLGFVSRSAALGDRAQVPGRAGARPSCAASTSRSAAPAR